MNAILSFDQTKQLGKFLQQHKKRIVLTGGCFDLFHFGHITLLEEAKRQGDILIVLLESDKRIQKLKGSDRPLHTQQQRAQMLSALRSVDYVICLPDEMDDKKYDEVVKQLQPAIIATTEGSDTEKYIERQAAIVGANIFLAKQVKHLSTSHILHVITKEL